jgi:hypothetical protein
MIKREKGKFILYKGKKKIGTFGSREMAEVWEKMLKKAK